MKNPIVRYLEPITLVGGGHIGDKDWDEAIRLAPRLVAADGGARAALARGAVPDRVIGDLDSLDQATRACLAPDLITHVTDQNSTDFDKCLRHCEAPLVVAIGVLGPRMDHGLAAMAALMAHAHRPIVLLGGADVIALCPPRIALRMPAGTRVSLFPMGAVSGRSSGLQWAIDGVGFAPDGVIGTSNRVADGADQVEITMEAPLMALILPRRMLGALAAALLEGASSGALWPVRA